MYQRFFFSSQRKNLCLLKIKFSRKESYASIFSTISTFKDSFVVWFQVSRIVFSFNASRILPQHSFKSQGLSFLSTPQGFSCGIVSSFKDCFFFEMVIRNFFFSRYNYQRFFVNFFFYCSYNYQGFFVLTLVAYSPYRRVCQGFFVLTLVVYPPYGRFCQMPFHRVYQGVFGGLSLFWKGV